MYLRRCRRSKGSKDHVYWELVESYRTERGPRQRVVAYLGDVAEAQRLGDQAGSQQETDSWQSRLFDDEAQPEWVEVDANRVKVERGPGLRRLLARLGTWRRSLILSSLLEQLLPPGREEIPWSMMALTLVLMRLCEPSSELRIAEHLYERSSLWRSPGHTPGQGE